MVLGVRESNAIDKKPRYDCGRRDSRIKYRYDTMTQCPRVDPERVNKRQGINKFPLRYLMYHLSFYHQQMLLMIYLFIYTLIVYTHCRLRLISFFSLSLNTNIDGYHGRRCRHSHTTTRTKNHEYYYYHHHHQYNFYHWSHYHHRKWWPSLVVYQNSEFLSVMSISFHTQHNRATTMVEYHSPRTISMLMNRYGSWYQMNPLVNIPYNNWYIPIDCNVDNGSTWPPSHSIQVSTMAFGTPIMPMVATIATWTLPWDVLQWSVDNSYNTIEWVPQFDRAWK